ncbi:MAG: hypothetical protein RLW62_16290, partial [Gammaproteobacteria bacterium]
MNEHSLTAPPALARSHLRRSRRRTALCLATMVTAALVALSSRPVAAALAASDFASDAEGWLGYACPNPGFCISIGAANLAVDWQADGGAPAAGGGAPEAANGYIETTDPGGSTAARLEPNPAVYAGL